MNRNDRAIVGLVMLAHAMVHTYELSVPILVSIWLSPDVFPGLSPATIGIVVTVGMGLFGLGALPAGLLADAYGSQRLIVACLLGMGAAFIALGVAPSVPLITAALVLWGIAASVYHPSGLSLISKGVNERGRAFAFHGMAGNLGIALGPLVTTLLLVVLDWRATVTVLALPAFVAALAAVRADVDETAAARGGRTATNGGPTGDAGDDDADADADGSGGDAVDPGADAGGSGTDDAGGSVSDAGDTGTDASDSGTGRSGSRADDGHAGATGSVSSLPEFLADSRNLFAGAFLAVFGVVILSGLYYRGVLTFLPELLGDVELFRTVEVGGRTFEPSRYVYAGLLMIGIAGQYVGGYLTDRLPTEWGIAGAFAVLAVVSLAFLPAAEAGLLPLLAASAALGFFLFTVQPLYQATVAEYTPAGSRGLSYGYTYLGVFGVGALGAALAGSVLTHWSESGLFLVFAVIAAAASGVGVLLSVLRDRRRP